MGNIGSAVEVVINRQYVKDHADDKLTFTYTNALIQTFANSEFGPLCPLADPICLSAGMISTVSALQGAGLAWQRKDSAFVQSNIGGARTS